jgi:hypothetical protein
MDENQRGTLGIAVRSVVEIGPVEGGEIHSKAS